LCKSNIFIPQITLLACKERGPYTQTENKLFENVENFVYFGEGEVTNLLQIKGILYYMSGKQVQRAKFGATG